MRCACVPAAVAALFVLAPFVAAPSAAQADILITVSKSDQRVAVDIDGSERYRWPVSTGRRGYDTPAGSFRPIRLERSWHSRKYDWAPMPHSIFFYKGYAMHGTVEERRLGRAASHGCVRLSRANATTLFALLRERGKSAARIEVIDGRLPAPMVDPRVNIAEVRTPLPPERQEAQAKTAPKAETTPEIKAEIKPENKSNVKVERAPEPAPVIKVAAKPHADKPEAAVPMPRAAVRVATADVAATDVATRDEAALPPKARIIAVTPPPAASPKVEIVRGGPFTAVGDDAAVLRGREAWLRSLDRKYGITR